jgi:hypothetical protein
MMVDVQFDVGKSYPIETLPDDLHDEKPATKMWAIRDALFWNDCQGWWMAHIADERRAFNFGESVARFWSPLPPDPMSREEICAERGWEICPDCDYAIINPKGEHACLTPLLQS